MLLGRYDSANITAATHETRLVQHGRHLRTIFQACWFFGSCNKPTAVTARLDHSSTSILLPCLNIQKRNSCNKKFSFWSLSAFTCLAGLRNFLSLRLQFSTANIQVGCKQLAWCVISIHPSLALHCTCTWRLLWHLGWFIATALKAEDKISLRYICVWHRLKQRSVRIGKVLSVSKADIIHLPGTSATTNIRVFVPLKSKASKKPCQYIWKKSDPNIPKYVYALIDLFLEQISDSQLRHLRWTRHAFQAQPTQQKKYVENSWRKIMVKSPYKRSLYWNCIEIVEVAGYGCFQKYGYPKMDGLFHGKPY